MHEYAVFGHDRSNIGRWLGLISILIAGGITQIAVLVGSLTGIVAISSATLTGGAVYVLLSWVFNKYLWRINFFGIPDLNGTWKVVGKTLDLDGEVRYDWLGEIGIEQDWKKISIHQKTTTSQSNSYTATLLKKPGPLGGWYLSYSYENKPEPGITQSLEWHKGYCEVEFSQDLKSATSAYFNSSQRRTFGKMILTRV